MAFPATTYTNGVSALTALENKAAAMGMVSSTLDAPGFIAAFLANYITDTTGFGPIGYLTGGSIGGTVTQITNRSTGVTLSKLTGTITTDTTSLAAEASANFVVTNTLVAINDVIILNVRSGSDGGNTAVSVTTVAAGSFTIKVANHNAAAGTAETGAIIINFAVIKGAVA